jgi:hypothetical protein
MDITDLINAIQADRMNVTQHARREAKEDNLLLDEILHSTRNGEIIEDYPTDMPYPSCLINGADPDGTPIHSVWAYAADSRMAVLITVYRPDPDRWIEWKIRK